MNGPETTGEVAALRDAEAIEEAGFLVRAPHRVEVLAELAAGPRTRPELEASTGVSRVTLGRSLAAMESRNWVERRDGRYVLRPLGGLVLDGVTGFLETTATSRHLGDVVDLLPTAEAGFDLRWLADAAVLVATRHDSGVVIRRYLELLADASRLLVLKDTVDLAAVRAISDRTATGALDADVVYSDGAIEATRARSPRRTSSCAGTSTTARASTGLPADSGDTSQSSTTSSSCSCWTRAASGASLPRHAVG